MEIKVLGIGCATCQKLYKHVEEVISENNIIATLEKIEDVEKIMAYGIMSVPALIINNKIIFAGKSPNKDQIKEYLLKDYN